MTMANSMLIYCQGSFVSGDGNAKANNFNYNFNYKGELNLFYFNGLMQSPQNFELTYT